MLQLITPARLGKLRLRQVWLMVNTVMSSMDPKPWPSVRALRTFAFSSPSLAVVADYWWFYRITVKNKSFTVSVPAGNAIAIYSGAKLWAILAWVTVSRLQYCQVDAPHMYALFPSRTIGGYFFLPLWTLLVSHLNHTVNFFFLGHIYSHSLHCGKSTVVIHHLEMHKIQWYRTKNIHYIMVFHQMTPCKKRVLKTNIYMWNTNHQRVKYWFKMVEHRVSNGKSPDYACESPCFAQWTTMFRTVNHSIFFGEAWSSSWWNVQLPTP